MAERSFFDRNFSKSSIELNLDPFRSQIYFILQLGYFKAQHLFFTFELHEVEDDVQYILEQYFPHVKMDKLSTVNKRTKLRQRRLIRKLYNYRNCGAKERQKLETKARQAATDRNLKPKFIPSMHAIHQNTLDLKNFILPSLEEKNMIQ